MNIQKDFVKIKNIFKKNSDKIFKFLFLILSIFISILIFVNRNQFSKFAEYGYIGVFLINLIGSATVIIPTPSIIATFIGGSIYNPLYVGIFSGIGATIGELTGFMAGYGGSGVVDNNPKYQKVKKWMEKNGFLTLLILSFLPNPFFDLSGIFAGATNYSIKKFLLAVGIGKTLRFIIVAFTGKMI